MKRLKMLGCLVVLLAVAGFASASHDEPWWCDIPFIGKFLPGCGGSHGGGGDDDDDDDDDGINGPCRQPGIECEEH